MTELALEAWLDQDDRNIAMKIREFGIFIRYVYGEQDSEETPFAYSVGLFGLAHPELLIFGLDESSTAGVLNALYERVRAGDDLTPGELVTLKDWPHRLFVEEVPNPAEIVFDVYRHYRYPPFEPLPLLQLTWDDRSGRFPWEPGYAVPDWVQPRPGSFEA